MSPEKKAAANAPAQPVLRLKRSSLATLLDLPAGVSVVRMGFQRDVEDTTGPDDLDATFAAVEGSESLLLTLDGVDWDSVRGWKPRRGAATPERISAEYTVDAHGRRSLTCLTLPDPGDPGGIVETDPTEEKE